MIEFADCSICVDCAMFHANADTTGIEDEVRVAEVTGVTEHFIVASGDDDDNYTAFSWRRCDACGSTLGGARYRAYLEVEDN